MIRGSTLSFCRSIYSNSRIKSFHLNSRIKSFHLHLYTILLHLDSLVAPNTNGWACSSLPCPVAVGTFGTYTIPLHNQYTTYIYIYIYIIIKYNIKHTFSNTFRLTYIYIYIIYIYIIYVYYILYIYICIYIHTYLWIMVWTNTTLVWCSEFYSGGYPTIFSQIWLTNERKGTI